MLIDTHFCLLEFGKDGHRLERAKVQAIIDVGPEVEDLQLEQLRRSVKILSTLLVLSVTLSFGLAAALAVWIMCKCSLFVIHVVFAKSLCSYMRSLL